MNPSEMPSYDQAVAGLTNTSNAVQGLRQSIQTIAPLAQSAHSPTPLPQYIDYKAPSTPSKGLLPGFWNWSTETAKEGANIAAGAASWVKNQLITGLEAPIKYGAGVANSALDKWSVDNLNAQTQELNSRLDNIIQSYKSGMLSKGDYLKALGQFNQDNTNVSSQLSAYESKTSIDQQNFTKAAINTVTDVAALMTGGLGAGLKAPEMLAGNQAAAELFANSADLLKGAQVIERLASNEADWQALSPLAQQAMRLATSETLQGAGASATAGQITRAAAADLLLKFPLYYNAISSTGQQVYDELNQNKYGDAVKTIAFNAALLLSGGPIGWGLKQGGKITEDAAIALGLRPGSMIDELSSRIGNGDRLALGKIAKEQINAGNSKDVRAMIVGLESNLKAAGGNVNKAISQITDHLENYVGWGSMKNMSHQEAWDNIVNYWKHSEGLQDLKAKGLIEGVAKDDPRVIVPGRFITADKNKIADLVSQYGKTAEDRLQVWQSFKDNNPNAAFANNPNVDKQITNLINQHSDGETLAKAINKIPTQVGLEGIPADYAAQMAKDGYIAIIPSSHNLPVVPFNETPGKLVTNAAGGGNYFVKAAAPVHVLQSVGAFLTNIGLSPDAAQQSVQQVFNQKFAESASKFGLAKGEGEAQDILAKISDYMKSPTRGVFGSKLKLPLSDMRQLSVGDIMAATGLGKTDAKIVGDAIQQAHLDVPVAVKGLGTQLIDANYRLNPAAGVISRLQGAARFSWNPFFTQLRLPMKAEILAQMQTGGKFPTIAGTNRFMSMFFPGQYKELNAIINSPEFKNIIGSGLGGETEGALSTLEQFASSEHLPKTTQLPVAGLIRSMADRMGLDAQTFMQQFPNETKDAVTALIHYDRNNSFLNSPLARTMNVALFPFRFNVKVTTFMAKFLASQPPAIQYAAIKGMMDSSKFLKSPQGQAWYSQHSDAIGLFKYISPLETISTISNLLQFKHDSIMQYGELGGLPFGWIPQATDAAGITHFGQAYVNPKTGEIAKDYVPTNMYGAINAAVQDLLGMLFAYPGATVGLTSKGTIERQIAGTLLPGSKNDFNAVNPTNLTPEEMQFSQTIQGNPQAKAKGIAQPVSGSHIPAQPSPLTIPKPRVSKGGSRRTKKSDFTPQLLPGQSKLGQL